MNSNLDKETMETIGSDASRTDEEPLATQRLFDYIAELSKNTRNVYFLYSGYLAYYALTVITTTGRQMVIDKTVVLPGVNAVIPLNGFLIAALFIAILGFIYCQCYLQRLNSLIFEFNLSYSANCERSLYPWIPNIARSPDSGVVGKTQLLATNCFLWCPLPLVSLLVVLWFLRKHDAALTYALGTLSLIGILIVLWFWCKYEPAKLRGFIRVNYGKFALAGGVVSIILVSCLFVIPWATQGSPTPGSGLKSLFARGLRTYTTVDLSYQKLVADPGIEDRRYPWGNLFAVHLEGANLTGALLQQADLRFAHLRRANITSAILEGAFLWKSDLQHADLNFTNLRNAYLKHSKLQHASIRFADLRGAYLKYAELQYADLNSTDLQDADLEFTNLEHADLSNANLIGTSGLTLDQLTTVKSLYKATLDAELVEQIRRDHPHLLDSPHTAP